jgi:ketosteroid isomerase-like protein
MAGPYQQYSDPELSQPNYSEPYPSHPIPAAASVYPGMLPPPVPYPSRHRWRLIPAILLMVVILACATTAVVYAVNAGSGTSNAGQLTEASVKTAIQDYLDALQNSDTDTVARNTLCGFYDQVKDKRSDQALARLSSETFRKQFSRAQVTSVDKMVLLSPNQAQVLFSMQVVPATRGSQKHQEQAIAQVLSQDNHLLVCQYLLRSAGSY